jgi:acyl-CoA synthetase (AMP-forming)/AMP-acid ligase II
VLPCGRADRASGFHLERAGVIGVPAPGVEIKLVPSGSKMESRVRGDNVTPGYSKRPDLTGAAFDEEGFYRTGDAGAFCEPAAPEKGLVFNGRTADDFKLPPSIDANAITDKGYINQRAVLETRAENVERLFSDPPEPAVIVVD